MPLIVDFHTHVVAPDIPADPTGEPRWPQIAPRGQDQAEVMIAGRVFRRIDSRSWDVARRLSDMDADGIDVQVLSPMPELLSFWFSPAAGARLCEAMNGFIAGCMAAAPARFRGYGMVCLQDPGMAAAQLRELARAGFSGVEIGTHVDGVPLGDARLDPFYSAAEAEGMAVMVHALHPAGLDRVGATPDAAVSIFPLETTLAALSLISADVPRRFPDLKLLLCHGGGALAMLLPRLAQGRRMGLPHLDRVPVPVSDAVRGMHVDSIVYDAETLRFISRQLGADRIVCGSDYPFAVMQEDPAGFVRSALGADAAQDVLRGPASLLRGGPEARAQKGEHAVD